MMKRISDGSVEQEPSRMIDIGKFRSVGCVKDRHDGSRNRRIPVVTSTMCPCYVKSAFCSILVVATVHDEDAHCSMVVKVTAVETWFELTRIYGGSRLLLVREKHFVLFTCLLMPIIRSSSRGCYHDLSHYAG